VGLQNIMALHSDWDTWQQELSQDGLLADYRALFGDPMAYAVEPLVPKALVQPALSLPWAKGQGFYMSSGPHPAYADGSAWAAIDFGPPDVLGNCFYSNEPNTRRRQVGCSGPSQRGRTDLDGDGIQPAGCSIFTRGSGCRPTPIQVGKSV
jgi:hypothetical protein